MFHKLALLMLLALPAWAGGYEEALRAVNSLGGQSFCGGEGARCVTNLDCCRGSCQNRICRSGFVPPTPCRANGSACGRSSDCCSGFCLRTCQPRIEP